MLLPPLVPLQPQSLVLLPPLVPLQPQSLGLLPPLVPLQPLVLLHLSLVSFLPLVLLHPPLPLVPLQPRIPCPDELSVDPNRFDGPNQAMFGWMFSTQRLRSMDVLRSPNAAISESVDVFCSSSAVVSVLRASFFLRNPVFYLFEYHVAEESLCIRFVIRNIVVVYFSLHAEFI